MAVAEMLVDPVQVSGECPTFHPSQISPQWFLHPGVYTLREWQCRGTSALLSLLSLKTVLLPSLGFYV